MTAPGAAGTVQPRRLIPFVGLIVAFGLLLSTGLLVQRQLDRRYFRREGAAGTLGSLGDRTVEHAFCSTDLVLGQPVYFSSWGGGSSWRATGRTGTTRSVLRYGADNLSLAEVVRASSAFPGIPPLRLRVDAKLAAPARGGRGSGRTPPGVLFLADGGLWNNLGSHVLREDGILHGEVGAGRGMPMLCVNSSAAGATSAPVTYSIPVVAQFAALFRTLRVLTVNTVQPRVDAITEAMARRNASGTRPGPLDPLEVVVDLTSVRRHEAAVGSLCRDRAGRADPVDLVGRLESWAAEVRGAPSVADNTRLAELVLGALAAEPTGACDDVGMLTFDVVESLVTEQWWTTLRSSTGPETLSVRTTLDRVDRTQASELLLRGYANTWLSSLLLDAAAARHRLPLRATSCRVSTAWSAASHRATWARRISSPRLCAPRSTTETVRAQIDAITPQAVPRVPPQGPCLSTGSAHARSGVGAAPLTLRDAARSSRWSPRCRGAPADR